MPDILVALVIDKVLVKVLVINLAPFRSSPCWEVNTVGHIAHMVLLWEVTLPNVREHLLAHPTVELTYTVHLLAGVASEGREAETLAMVVGVLATHADELVPRDAKTLWVAAHILAEESLVEVIVTSWNWSVNGIKRRGTNQLKSLVEAQSVLLDIVAKALQVAKGSMTLVAVIDILLDTQLLQSQHTSDTEQNLLLQTVLPVTTIERVSDRLVVLRVHVIVSIEEIQLNTPHVYLPYISMYHVVGVRHVHNHRVAVLVKYTLNGQGVKVLGIVVGNLLTVHAQRLLEVTKAIEETYGAEIHVAVRSLLQIIAGKHTKTTGVDFQNLVQTILHAEVSYRWTLGIRLHVHVFTEHLIDFLHPCHGVLLLDNGLFAVIAQVLQEQNRIGIALFVQVRVKALEQTAALVIPGPPHVVSNLVQALQFLRKA